jgi:uncharacterized protein YecE (DUF72 family)
MPGPGRLGVGTSGFRYWPGDIYPPKTSTDQALRLYAQALNTLELNRTFYQLPRVATIRRMKAQVPSDFVFVAKIWRHLTHELKLKGFEKDWALFLERLTPLISPQGALLLQLPKTFPQDLSRLEDFLKTIPKNIRVAVEFRSAYWFCERVYKCLRRYEAALVGISAPGIPCVLNIRTAPFAYFRLHGPRAWYKDRYTLEELAPFVKAAQAALTKGDVYVFFDNTIDGHAYWNASEFQQAVALR